MPDPPGQQPSPTTRVLVVEDQRTLADALEIGINAQPDLQCVAAVHTVDEALHALATGDPDLVLMDVHLPGTDGIEGTRRVRAAHPTTRVLILTADATPQLLAAAAAAGAAGFLGKDTAFTDILAAIRSPIEGKILVEGDALARLLDGRESGAPAPPGGGAAPPAGLTCRETEVLALLGEGLDPQAIADRLVVSVHTARGHVKRIMMKLDAHSQLQAVVTATRMGLLDRTPTAERPT